MADLSNVSTSVSWERTICATDVEIESRRVFTFTPFPPPVAMIIKRAREMRSVASPIDSADSEDSKRLFPCTDVASHVNLCSANDSIVPLERSSCDSGMLNQHPALRKKEISGQQLCVQNRVRFFFSRIFSRILSRLSRGRERQVSFFPCSLI